MNGLNYVVKAETPNGGTADVLAIRKFSASPDFVQWCDSVGRVLNEHCKRTGSRAGLAGGMLVWDFLLSSMLSGPVKWDVIRWGSSEFVAAGYELNDWKRGLALLLVCGLVKRVPGGLLMSPHFAYRGPGNDWMAAAERFAKG